jgi:hypothetical protein
MNSPSRIEQDHDINAIATRFPELAPSANVDDATLKQLETKYRILLQIADQSLRDRELKLKEGAARIDRWANPLMVGVLAGALGLMGTVVNGIWSNRNQAEQLKNQNLLERTRLENDLIKEATKPASEQDRAKSLVFFATNGLIHLDSAVVASLVKVAGTEQPVPGSSGFSSGGAAARPISFMQSVVDRILASPGTPYPQNRRPPLHVGDTTRKAIILHDAIAGDGSITILRNGFQGLRGPLAHWVVQSNGTIAAVADETVKANHVGRADRGLTNSNTIGISVTGIGALSDDRQTENLVRLVADVADRWGIPAERIFSHGEVAVPRGSKVDMLQQAPAIREMVEAVKGRH